MVHRRPRLCPSRVGNQPGSPVFNLCGDPGYSLWKQPIILDKPKKIRFTIGVEKFIVPKTILFLVLTLFLAEYLNPSAIGVRADYTPTPTGSPTSGSQTPSASEAPSVTPHFMIKAEAYRPGELFSCQVLFSSVKSLTEQTNQKKIFHPPAFIL